MSRLNDSTIEGSLTVKGDLIFNSSHKFRYFTVTTTKTFKQNDAYEDFNITFDPPMNDTNYCLLFGLGNTVTCSTGVCPVIYSGKTVNGCQVRLYNDHPRITNGQATMPPGLQVGLLFFE